MGMKSRTPGSSPPGDSISSSTIHALPATCRRWARFSRRLTATSFSTSLPAAIWRPTERGAERRGCTVGAPAKTWAGQWGRIDRDVFGLYGRNEVQKYSGPGGWNDPDYLSLGYLAGGRKTTLTPDEQYTYMSLWCLTTAPLILSGDIARLDDFTLSLLTNDEVLEVNQDPLGQAARRVAKTGELEVWAKDMEDGRKAVGLFNLDADTRIKTTVTVKWSDLGITGKHLVRDLWRQKDLGTFDRQFSAPVGADGVVLVSLKPQPAP